ncbi:Uncharacterised protein [Legionella hackeliae]|uniref:Uncharacterized protein n=1 Tax=Legionella hackeliae TaxID=449 RepID=A0A0A8UMS4_LEGHA|nr:hypothetical protein Lhac_0553 [Legionella hackeliae]CEK10135.1 conserved protein of unknown function [Legionella hackeliae]STX46860.1 Uncharacterised protein [Legionella hackeliae]
MNFKALAHTSLIQCIFFASIFLGFLLDPLIGIWLAGFYFFIIGSFFIYRFFRELHKI